MTGLRRAISKPLHPGVHVDTLLTSGAERPVVGRVAAVAQVAVVLLHALAAVAAVHPEAGAVALAAGLDAGRHLGPLLQVQGDAVHPQGPDAAQETPLAACSALREREKPSLIQISV